MLSDDTIRESLRDLRLPLPVTDIELEDYVDADGEDALRVWVILDERTEDRSLSGPAVIQLKAAIRDRLAELGVRVFPYVFLTKVSEPNGASHRKLAGRAAASGGVALTAVRDRLSGVPPEARASAVVALLAEREQAAKPSPGLQQEHLWLAGLIAFVLLVVGVGFVVALRSRAEHTRHARAAVERAAQALNAEDLPKCRSELLQSWQVAADSGSTDVRGQWEQLVQMCLQRDFAEVRHLIEDGQLRSAQQRLADGQVQTLLGKANRPGLRQTEEELKRQI